MWNCASAAASVVSTILRSFSHLNAARRMIREGVVTKHSSCVPRLAIKGLKIQNGDRP